jgi:hypothetical protein
MSQLFHYHFLLNKLKQEVTKNKRNQSFIKDISIQLHTLYIRRQHRFSCPKQRFQSIPINFKK